MIESKVDKKYNIWVMVGLCFASIFASAYDIWQVYATSFSGTAADIVIAILQIILFDGVLSVAISYIWGMIMHSIMSKALNKWVITRFDFCLYYMFFIAIARVVIAIVGAFQFVYPAMAVFVTYLSSLIFSTSAMAVFFFAVLKKVYVPKGIQSKAFLGFAIPYLIFQALNFIVSALLCLQSSYFEPILNKLGYVLYYDANEIYAVIASGVVLALFVLATVLAYFWLKKKDKDTPKETENTFIPPSKEEEKVFEEFDI